MRSVLPSFRRRHFPDFSPLFFHLFECTHTNTETAQLLFRFLNSKSPVKLQLFRTHNIPILASFFALFSYDFSFLLPISLQRQRKIHHCWRHFPGEFSFSSSCGMLGKFLHQFSQNDANFICSLLSVLLFILKKIEQKVSLTFILSLTTRIFQKEESSSPHQSIQSDSCRP